MRKFTKLIMVMMCMILTLFFGMSTQAEASNVTSGTMGYHDGISWTYDGDTKTLTITGEESNLHGKWDSSKRKYKSPFAAICEDVEVIKVQNCTLKGSAKAMFANLEYLRSVEFTNVNTSAVTDMIEMFSGCRKLSSVDVSEFDTSNVTSMRGMFYYCSSLGSLDVSKFNTSNVTDMSIMFYYCIGLSSLDMSNFDLTNVADISYMFSSCNNLACIETPKSMSATMSINLPTTYVAANSERTTKLTKNFGNTTLINVNFLVSEIQLNFTSLTIDIGQTEQLTATISPQKALNKSLSWKSSNIAVATVDANGKVTAVAPGSTTITATANDGSEKSADCIITVNDENPFADVKESSWQYPFVKFVYDQNIMAGKGKTEDGMIIFAPDNYMTRAEFVQSLYNKEGKPDITYEATFTDVPNGKWFTNAILWASKNGIVAGKGERFDISGKITREEVATILYKYATNYKKYDTTGRASLDAYEDAELISSWAVNNMKWAIHYGIMKGRGNLLAPWDNASRAECATMLKNFMDAYNE